MNFKFGILNICLCMAVAGASYKVHETMQRDTAPVLPAPGQVTLDPMPPATTVLQLPEEALFDEIASRTLFHPDRVEIETAPATAKPPDEKKKIKGPHNAERVYLYGIIAADGIKSALIGSNKKNKETGKTMQWVEIGDQYEDLEIVAIDQHEMVLNRDGVEMTIDLFDPSKPKSASPGQSKRQTEPRVFDGQTKPSGSQKMETPGAETPPAPAAPKIKRLKKTLPKKLPKSIALPQVSQIESIPIRGKTAKSP